MPSPKDANLQMRPRDPLSLQLISRPQKSIPLEKMDALESEFYGIVPCCPPPGTIHKSPEPATLL